MGDPAMKGLPGMKGEAGTPGVPGLNGTDVSLEYEGKGKGRVGRRGRSNVFMYAQNKLNKMIPVQCAVTHGWCVSAVSSL